MKKLLIISLCFTLSFLSIGPTASNVFAATSENEVPAKVIFKKFLTMQQTKQKKLSKNLKKSLILLRILN